MSLLPEAFTPHSANFFREIYIETAAVSYPFAQKILAQFKNRAPIEISSYKEIFNRPRQNVRLQKQNPALILAVKEPPFLYPGPEVCQNFGYTQFYYTSLLLNCFYDCEYCYLQGMYTSADIVAFVNLEDFQAAIQAIASLEAPPLLALSYDTDLLALHSILPFLEDFYPFMAQQPGVDFEIRSKSASQAFLKKHLPLPNLFLAYTLTPQPIIEQLEHKTPSLKARLVAIKTALEQGYTLRLCFDPIIIDQQFVSGYEDFFTEVFQAIGKDAVDSQQLVDISYGFFRMNRDFFQRIRKNRPDSQIFRQSFAPSEVISYSSEDWGPIQEKHLSILEEYISRERIFVL